MPFVFRRSLEHLPPKCKWSDGAERDVTVLPTEVLVFVIRVRKTFHAEAGTIHSELLWSFLVYILKEAFLLGYLCDNSAKPGSR